jgi:Domain of unknown function (DUF3883)
MLKQELTGQNFNKTAHRNALLPKLNNRTRAAVEFKHQNISAVLTDLNAPSIVGYKPAQNYQRLLFDVISKRWNQDLQIDELAIASLELPAVELTTPNFANIFAAAPKLRMVADPSPTLYIRRTTGLKRDYLKLEANNRSLGLAGEAFIVAFERYRLIQLGAFKLAEKVEHVSITKGDGLGYDILSFDLKGKERLIEVKTTSLGQETPFYISDSELSLSKAEPDLFKICRLYEFRKKPKLFELAGAVTNHCLLDPVNFLARFG